MRFSILIGIVLIITSCKVQHQSQIPDWMNQQTKILETVLVKEHGEEQLERISRGLEQVSKFWRLGDGDEQEFEHFVRSNFVSDSTVYNKMLERFQSHLEVINGHMNKLSLKFRWQTDLELGIIYSFDRFLPHIRPVRILLMIFLIINSLSSFC